MNHMSEVEIEYEKKLARISDQIEELFLDAMIGALEKIKMRNQSLIVSNLEQEDDGIPF